MLGAICGSEKTAFPLSERLRRVSDFYLSESLCDACHESHSLLQAASHAHTHSFASGFRSISQFNRIFKKLTKVSPGEYRKRGNAE